MPTFNYGGRVPFLQLEMSTDNINILIGCRALRLKEVDLFDL